MTKWFRTLGFAAFLAARAGMATATAMATTTATATTTAMAIATTTAVAMAAPAVAPSVAAGSHPTLAVEDTLSPRVTETFPEILVNAPRMALDEILARVAAGEAERDSLIRDQAYTQMIRMVGRDSKKTPNEKSEAYYESATRIYQKRPRKEREVLLKEWSRDDHKDAGEKGPAAGTDEKKKNGVTINVDSNMSEQFIAFAFDPATRSRFRFRIEDRKIVGEHVVYILGFEPRAPLDLLPTGRAWVDTNDFVILREEFSYRDRSPAPMFLESLDSCVLERTRIDQRYWVISRVLARVTLTDPIRWAGRLVGEKVPKVADFAVARTEWIINGNIPDSLFSPQGGGEGK